MLRFTFLLLSTLISFSAFAQSTGTFVDSRDDQSYKTFTKDGVTWMAQNLNYELPDSYCYDGKTENCNTYGRLYTWDQAVQACPEGWHLSTMEEWMILAKWDGNGGYIDKVYDKTVHSPLKGYNALTRADQKFGALMGGRVDANEMFGSIKQYGMYWTSDSYDAGKARRVRFNSDARKLYIGRAFDKGYGYSARCVKDAE